MMHQLLLSSSSPPNFSFKTQRHYNVPTSLLSSHNSIITTNIQFKLTKNWVSHVSSSNLFFLVKCRQSSEYFEQSSPKFSSSYSPNSPSSSPGVNFSPKVFVSHSIYKGKAALTVDPKAPEFAPLDSGSFKLSRDGYILLQFAPAAGVRQYDWSRKQVFSLSVSEIRSLVSLGTKDSCEFYHDPNKGKRDKKSDAFKPRSWFGPNGQYIKELPCPSCRGRGYTPCTECGIEWSRQDCSLCNGKGIMACQRCLGECVIWEELIDEIPWEKARSISPFKVKEDDDVDNMELQPTERKKSNRVYRSTSPEVGQKISRSLKSLNAKTGLFSKRMKLIHRNPTLHAQRVAAIKKVRGTEASRKHTSEMLKKFFSDPENRRKRSNSMRGVRFFCKNCGQEGHRSFYCPKRGETADRRFKCGLCGEKGHNRLTCQKPRISKPKIRNLREYHCRACGKVGHNRRTCPVKTERHSQNAAPIKRGSHCSVCGKGGHNRRTCSLNTELLSHSAARENPGLQDSREKDRKHHHHCSVCGKVGHNRRTCSQQNSVDNAAVSPRVRWSYF